MVTKELSVIDPNTLGPRTQVSTVAANIRSVIAFIQRTFDRLTSLPTTRVLRPSLVLNGARDIDAIKKSV